MDLKWMTKYDQFLAEELIPAVFVLSHEAELKIDVERTRDFVRENPQSALTDRTDRMWCHCVVIDKATSWPQYMLFTQKGLCAHPRAEIIICDDFVTAQRLLEEKRALLYNAQ